jgi:hypothetical protein
VGTVVSVPEGNLVGIGIAAPPYQLSILNEGDAASRGMGISQYASDNSAPPLTFSKSRGSVATPAAVALGDRLGNVQVAGYDGSAWQYTSRMMFVVDGPVISGAVPTSIQFLSGTSGNGLERMRITSTGNVGIGTTAPGYPLSVNGTIQAKEVLVNTGWSDYVFDPGYRLQPLSEVATYVQENHHLPEIPSAAEVAEKGISLGNMQSKLLAKIEELTLHMIRAERENRELKERLVRLEQSKAQVNQ